MSVPHTPTPCAFPRDRAGASLGVRNGECCEAPAQLIQPTDAVSSRGDPITAHRRHRHVLLHKPAGHVSTRREVRQLKGGGREEDPRPTVYDLLDEETRARNCTAVGRLDVDTT